MATFEYDSMYLVVVFIVAHFQMLLLLQKSTSNQDDLEVLIRVCLEKSRPINIVIYTTSREIGNLFSPEPTLNYTELGLSRLM